MLQETETFVTLMSMSARWNVTLRTTHIVTTAVHSLMQDVEILMAVMNASVKLDIREKMQMGDVEILTNAHSLEHYVIKYATTLLEVISVLAVLGSS